MHNILMVCCRFVLILICCASIGPVFAENVSGQVAYAHIYHLDVGVSGEVSSVSVEEGNRVTAGTVLMQLDTTVLGARNKAALARTEYYEALMQEAERALGRDQELYDDGSLSTVELDLRKIQVLKASADFAQSQAEYIQSVSHLNLSKVVAPVAGIVIQRNTNPGERIILENRIRPAFIFASENKVVRANIDVQQNRPPQTGSSVKIELDGSQSDGQVTAVDSLGGAQYVTVTISSEQPLPAVGTPVQISFQAQN